MRKEMVDVRFHAFGHDLAFDFLAVELLLQFGVILLKRTLAPVERFLAVHHDVDPSR